MQYYSTYNQLLIVYMQGSRQLAYNTNKSVPRVIIIVIITISYLY